MRHRPIIGTARRLAESEGWDAVTTSQLSDEIEYSQPVLYTHFANMEQLAQAVAVDGFGELAQTLRTARSGAATPTDALRQLAHAYIDFGRQNPALYDAMFTRATTLYFAADDTLPQLVAAFAELHDTVAVYSADRDPDTLAEVLWSALHGLVTLSRTHPITPRLRRRACRSPHRSTRQRVRVDAVKRMPVSRR